METDYNFIFKKDEDIQKNIECYMIFDIINVLSITNLKGINTHHSKHFITKNKIAGVIENIIELNVGEHIRKDINKIDKQYKPLINNLFDYEIIENITDNKLFTDSYKFNNSRKEFCHKILKNYINGDTKIIDIIIKYYIIKTTDDYILYYKKHDKGGSILKHIKTNDCIENNEYLLINTAKDDKIILEFSKNDIINIVNDNVYNDKFKKSDDVNDVNDKIIYNVIDNCIYLHITKDNVSDDYYKYLNDNISDDNCIKVDIKTYESKIENIKKYGKYYMDNFIPNYYSCLYKRQYAYCENEQIKIKLNIDKDLYECLINFNKINKTAFLGNKYSIINVNIV